jgi:6-phosphogluconate dehydrogenase (decarboxylating)
VETAVSTLKSEMATGFNEIKLLLEKQSNARTIQIIATAGTIVTAVLALAGYILTH